MDLPVKCANLGHLVALVLVGRGLYKAFVRFI